MAQQAGVATRKAASAMLSEADMGGHLLHNVLQRDGALQL
jgi:hypothetical protein